MKVSAALLLCAALSGCMASPAAPHACLWDGQQQRDHLSYCPLNAPHQKLPAFSERVS